MKTLEEKIEVMQGYLDGKIIQDNIYGEWTDWACPNPPLFEWTNHDYRIKPENKQVPYDFSDAERLIGRVFKHKRTSNIFLSTYINSTNINFGSISYTFSSMAEELEIWNNTLNRWESCTKTVKG